MNTLELDVLILGFGKAGKTIAMKRGQAGDRAAIVEQSPVMYGGTCINIGCLPTKTLLTDAHRHHLGGSQAQQGKQVQQEHAAAFAQAQEHRDSSIATLNAANKKMALGNHVMVIDGRARFTGPHTVEVTGGDETLRITAETIIINTGAVPVLPPLPGIEGERVVDSTAVQHLPQYPEHLVIVGGGPIGLEFATMFAQFGTRVTVLDGAGTFLPRFDRDIAEAVRADLESLGITIMSGARAQEFRAGEQSVSVIYGEGEVEADYALVALGRRPATSDLGLEVAWITTTERGAIEVDEYLRTSVPGVYAAGDANGGPQFTYISYDDHRVILNHRWGDGTRSTEGRIYPTTTFLEPPLSQIGLGEEEARKECESRGHALSVKAQDIKDMAIVPRPKILGQPQGRAKFLIDAQTDEILGATLYCVDSQELINAVALAMRHGISATELGEGIYTHPSSSEVFNALLG
ncbi:FAD-dependent oxidoreductase [Corynebacterium lowii]|uniref:Dihydrolipoyl dehydrogenase n=1 Tax=Corynebacterium lowii TaxID=1544413 RepID=A0A0N8W0H9_9CORY|nr:FAD-dependent oxidoreductase [Corynebacterium lowii]KQB86746.1 Dihydrolipoyl dehydrogenase [Corynebacterium lowii]MDP9851432.1 pyruvate/2-oxoglutarate dehydrogenase complex dihydrolipoamide dehydrogenase (E3) component [Corynebacterium lowii]